MISHGYNYDEMNIDGGVYEDTALSCQKSCQILSDCNFWTWDSFTSYCYKKSSKSKFQEAKNSISGPKYCGMLILN